MSEYSYLHFLEYSPVCNSHLANYTANLIKKESRWNLIVEIKIAQEPYLVDYLKFPTIRFIAYYGQCLSSVIDNTCSIGFPPQNFSVLCNTKRQNCNLTVYILPKKLQTFLAQNRNSRTRHKRLWHFNLCFL